LRGIGKHTHVDSPHAYVGGSHTGKVAGVKQTCTGMVFCKCRELLAASMFACSY